VSVVNNKQIIPFSERQFINMLYFGSLAQEGKLDLAQTIVEQALLHLYEEGK